MHKLPKTFACLILLLSAASATFATLPDATSKQLRWRGDAVEVAVSSSLNQPGPQIKYNSDVAGAVRRSLETWRSASGIELRPTSSDKQSLSPSGPRGDGVNLITIAQTPENLALFPEGAADAAATTRVFFDRRRFVVEADIVLNPYQQFSTDGTYGTFDLESTLAHEIGHLLGLAHSNVLSATMYEKYGKNGVVSNFAARTLAESDISEIRRVYGTPNDTETCCGNITGKLLGSDARARTWQIWAEDPQTGRVVGETSAAKDGTFELGGLSERLLKVFGQERSGAGAAAFGELGKVQVNTNEESVFKRKATAAKNPFRLEFLGLNGQLSDLAITLTPGDTHTVYLGGTGLQPGRISVGTTSPFFAVTPNSIAAVDFGSDVAVISFELRVADTAIPGEYTIYVASENGARRYIVGGIAIAPQPDQAVR